MKITVLTDTQGWGGTELHTLALAETLVARGHQVCILEVGRSWYGTALAGAHTEIRTVQVEARCRIGRHAFREIWRLLGAVPGDVAVFPKGIFEAGSLALDLAARLRFRRYLAIQHTLPAVLPPRTSARHLGGLIPGLGLWWWRQEMAPRWARSLGPHLTVAVSEAVRQQLVRHYRFPKRKVVTIRSGIDPDRYQPDAKARQAARRAWSIRADALVFGAVGRLDPMKGYDLALRAFREVSDRFPARDLCLVLVGTGPAEPDLRAEAARLGLEDRVLFAGFTARPWEIYPAFDVFLLPSRVEGLPLSLLEAMAAGCCPVAMGVGGVPEILTSHELGWLIAAGDAAGFRAAMQAAVSAGPVSRGAMAARARAEVVARFNAQEQFGALADCLGVTAVAPAFAGSGQGRPVLGRSAAAAARAPR